ncbi:hypothetical protein [Paracraurococcus lichenis]|uniref:Proteophosphoglycan ppg4 n=1 Tax=Paracraurococcus lichenis TaxID=3064888 RepID=A0ABT9E3D3_9PROT|nr:hypothetical protein [Paracraurococcus sp. LOR1-02]MDO9710668.1 hypothetical protein [Paracraurococcus sp. LOR1-02]
MIRQFVIGLAAVTLAAAPALAQRDGTPGNPPSTATQRALDHATGSTPTPPDGTPGNPRGTAAGRALDHATGSNTTGTNPSHSSGVSRHSTTNTHRNTTGTTTTTR